jgi:hypothetical protein
MAIHILQIEKYRFVCGLFWQSLSRPRELQKEARELARKIDSDLLVLRSDHSTAQAGFAHSGEGAKRGMFSLGAIVSKTLAIEGAYYDGEQQRVHNWLAALKLPDGHWAYFAVRDANFLPNGDFAGTKEQVLERLHGDYGLGGWNVVIGDPELADYGFHNFEARSIESLIPHRKDGRIRPHRWWGLQPLNTRRPQWPVVAAGVLALAVAAGLYWQHKRREQAERELEQAIAAARLKMQHPPAPAAPPPPWGDKPAPRLVAGACVERFGQLAPGGWQLDDYVCSADQVRYSWSRQGSTVAMLLAQVPGAEIALGGERASRVEPLQLARTAPEALLNYTELMEPIVSQLQLMGVPFTMANATPKPAVPGAPQLAPAWRAVSFKIEAGGLPPLTVAAVLDKPGVRIDQLVFHGGHWSIEGVMYVK